MDNAMIILIILSLFGFGLPYFSKQVPGFVLLCMLAVALPVAGFFLCVSVARGWDGLVCVVIGAFVAPFVLAGIATGIVRVVTSGGGEHDADGRKVLVGALVSYGLAALSILIMVLMVQ